MYERTYQDLKRIHPLIGQVFFERHPKQPEQIRTYRLNWNGLANKIQVMVSNWHTAEPTPEMKPYNQRVMSAVATQQSTQMGDFY